MVSLGLNQEIVVKVFQVGGRLEQKEVRIPRIFIKQIEKNGLKINSLLLQFIARGKSLQKVGRNGILGDMHQMRIGLIANWERIYSRIGKGFDAAMIQLDLL